MGLLFDSLPVDGFSVDGLLFDDLPFARLTLVAMGRIVVAPDMDQIQRIFAENSIASAHFPIYILRKISVKFHSNFGELPALRRASRPEARICQQKYH